jgi:hypothetical protein
LKDPRTAPLAKGFAKKLQKTQSSQPAYKRAVKGKATPPSTHEIRADKNVYMLSQPTHPL